jgi:thiamine biosynthesis lipoprotein
MPQIYSKFTNRYVFVIVSLLIGFASCTSKERLPSVTSIEGETMGTTYHIKCVTDIPAEQLKKSCDSLLLAINAEVSTYDTGSLISRFNRGERLVFKGNAEGDHLVKNLSVSRQIYVLSDGAFNPTVMPLVNYWGFGYKGHEVVPQIDSTQVDSLKQLVDYNAVVVSRDEKGVHVFANKANVQLDLSAVAKGYGVDQVGLLLEQYGIKSYLVEIGGEVRARGEKVNGAGWTIGISVPDKAASANDFSAIVTLSDKSMATSGNYRNYRKNDSYEYAHTINPKTGYPEQNNLLSASILAENCDYADACATACMVKGFPEAKRFIESIESVEGLFIYLDDKGQVQMVSTAGFPKFNTNE